MIKFYSTVLLSFVLLLGTQTIQAQQTKQDIKSHFQNGNAPGAAHFGYLIDACYNYSVGEGLIYDPTNNTLQAEVPLDLLLENLEDTTLILRNERDSLLNELNLEISGNKGNLTKQIQDLESKTNGIINTATNFETSINSSLDLLDDEVFGEIGTLRGDLSDQETQLSTQAGSIAQLRHDLISETNSLSNNITDLKEYTDGKLLRLDTLKTQEIADTVRFVREKISSLNKQTNTKLTNEIRRVDDRIDTTYSSLHTTDTSIRSDFNTKLSDLETALQDTDKDLRGILDKFNDALIFKIGSDSTALSNLVEQTKGDLIDKIDSLANACNIGLKNHQKRMDTIENKQSTLRDTVVKMKIKLDTLNFTEENFTQTLRLKLDNIEDGATKADNDFTDALKTKLDGIENNANNYTLSTATPDSLGGIKTSADFFIDPKTSKMYIFASDKIDREYATDTIAKNWTKEMKKGDEWTRMRLKIDTDLVDADDNKLYDYGEWAQPFKFIYTDLETSFYQYNATDTVNVILGIHEKNKAFSGKYNTLLGHNAGYTLYKGGERNVAIGNNAGRGSAYVSDNVFIGSQSGESVSKPNQSTSVNGDFSSERNIAIGTKAMQGKNTSGKSVAVGYAAMELGEQNSSVAIGYQAANKNSGTNNITIGYEACFSVPGSGNTSTIAIGYRAGYKNTYAKHNIFIGDSTALINESGEKNIFIGHGTGKSNTGNGNLFIGNAINLAGDDQLAIGNKGKILLSGDFTTNTVSIDKLSTGQLTVANSSSDSYSIGKNEVINSLAQFVGKGGVSTSGQITTSYANTKGNVNTAISAPKGSVSAKYISAADAITIGSADVINSTGTFVGSGGVNSIGNITTSSNINATQITGKSAELTQSLKVAGLDIVKQTGGVLTERYAVKIHQHEPHEIKTNSTQRFVSETEKTNWNNKVDKVQGSDLSTNDFTTAYRQKLDGISNNANYYSHPLKHAPNIIAQDALNRFVTDSDIKNWNGKVNKDGDKKLTSNDFTKAYRDKLDGIAEGANYYEAPDSYDPENIIQNTLYQFVTEENKRNWNNKVDKKSGKGLSTNDFTDADNIKLKSLNVHPNTHSATMITTTTEKQFVSQDEKDKWNGGQIPIGGIIMWNGTAVPAGWALCNGQLVNGTQTPDLRGRFIVSSYAGKTNFEVGNSGGTVGSAVQTNSAGSHNHTGNSGGYKLTGNDIPSHSHGMAHTHKIYTKKGARYSATADESTPGGKSKGGRRTMQNARDYNFSTEASSRSYTDSYGETSATINAHQHTISTDGSHVHTVPYYVLAFIMRVE